MRDRIFRWLAGGLAYFALLGLLSDLRQGYFREVDDLIHIVLSLNMIFIFGGYAFGYFSPERPGNPRKSSSEHGEQE